MMTKEWITEFQGHKIRVVKDWLAEAKLYVDGDCRDVNRQLVTMASRTPLLSAKLDLDDGRRFSIVEVFMTSMLTTKAKICIDGRQVGGESF
ncbi:MAG TPA: hypothetical protein VGQ83_02475 [Polyangia bacterium]|jgi:hypothetical protein